jgi:hypothetical protein
MSALVADRCPMNGLSTGGNPMSLGPVELLAIKFPGNQFTGGIARALVDLLAHDTIRVIDILFVNKTENETLEFADLYDLDEDTARVFGPLATNLIDLLTLEDARRFVDTLEPNSSIGLMLFENTWAAPFASAVRDAKGEVLLNERVPHVVIEELMAAHATA